MSVLEFELGCVVAVMTGVLVQISRIVPLLRSAALEPPRNSRRLEALLKHFRIPSPVPVESTSSISRR